jgi:hypothetical protein
MIFAPEGAVAVVEVSKKLKDFRIVALAIAIALLCGSIPFAYRYFTNQTIDPDPFIYGHIATEMLAGKKLYLQTWEDKPPLTFFCYAIPQVLGYRTYGALGLLLGIWLVAQGLLFFTAFARNLPVAVCCLLFTILFPLCDGEWIWPSTEHFSNLFIAGMLLIAYAIWREQRFAFWQCASAGILMVIAFHIRQNNVLPGLLPMAAILASDQPAAMKRRGIATLLGGALVSWLMILLIMLRIGDLGGYFYTVFAYPQLFARAGNWPDVARLALLLAPMALWLLLMFSAAAAMTRRFRWFVGGSLVLGIVMCLLPRRPYVHYWLNLFPFIALYMGIGLGRAGGVTVLSPPPVFRGKGAEAATARDRVRVGVTTNPINAGPHPSPPPEYQGREKDTICGIVEIIISYRTAWALSAAFLFAGGLMLAGRLWTTSLQPSYHDYQLVAAAVDQVARPDSTLLVYGPMPAEAIIFTSKVPAANTYCFTFQFLPPYPQILPVPQDQIFLQYSAHPPDIIAIDRKYLADAQAPGSPNAPQSLIRLLLGRFAYSTKAAAGNFDILQRN